VLCCDRGALKVQLEPLSRRYTLLSTTSNTTGTTTDGVGTPHVLQCPWRVPTHLKPSVKAIDSSGDTRPHEDGKRQVCKSSALQLHSAKLQEDAVSAPKLIMQVHPPNVASCTRRTPSSTVSNTAGWLHHVFTLCGILSHLLCTESDSSKQTRPRHFIRVQNPDHQSAARSHAQVGERQRGVV
jgi:hypothetical protein